MNLDKELLLQCVEIEQTLFLWMAVHGNLCLALRHPGNQGPSTDYVRKFVRVLGQLLIDKGVFTEAEIAAAMETEVVESARQRS